MLVHIHHNSLSLKWSVSTLAKLLDCCRKLGWCFQVFGMPHHIKGEAAKHLVHIFVRMATPKVMKSCRFEYSSAVAGNAQQVNIPNLVLNPTSLKSSNLLHPSTE